MVECVHDAFDQRNKRPAMVPTIHDVAFDETKCYRIGLTRLSYRYGFVTDEKKKAKKMKRKNAVVAVSVVRPVHRYLAKEDC